MTFQSNQKQKQNKYLQRPEFKGKIDAHKPYQFRSEYKQYNLSPLIRDTAISTFNHSDPKQAIQWHLHSGHGCSSQACCVNFLFPLAQDPVLLQIWLEHITGDHGIELLSIEERDGRSQMIAFEWFPKTDYLNEAVGGQRSRGANSTSVDAAIKYKYDEQIKLLLIEWKYIESYSHTRASEHLKGDPTRNNRYHNIWRRPHGPLDQTVNLSLEDFYLEPWYQLLRQQMLAYHTELDPLSGYDHVSVLHISPSKNTSLRKVQGIVFQDYAKSTTRLQEAERGDRFKVFHSLIAPEWQNRFYSISTESAFSCFDSETHILWLRDRYPDLF